MIVLGGATRLTNSGLSITEWRPISGVLPPLSDAGWALEFEKYRKIPEFSAENPDMDMAGFKFIYFMEWSHRQLGRFIGLAYALPMVAFMILGKLGRGHGGRFIFILFLIGLQGAIGWWMVASGLKGGRVDVSHYRLAVHLGMAFVILGFLQWTWMDVRKNWPPREIQQRLGKRTAILLLFVFLQIIGGAFVAGTHAGQAYNTWPLMDGGIVPGGYLAMQPLWINMVENTASIQFNHRVFGYIVLLSALWLWLSARRIRETHMRLASGVVLLAVVLQVVLGIAALLTIVELPYALAHQAGAIFVFLAAVWAARQARVRLY